MATQIVIPNVGESVTSGVISSWSVPDGAFVERDQTVLELETDKVTMEVPAPAAGIIKHGAAEGDEVNVGAVVGTIDESASKPAGAAGSAAKSEGGTAVAAPPAPKTEAKADTKPAASAPAPAASPAPAAHAASGDHKATPLARKLAEDNKVDLGSISGTGAGGRIREQDVLAYIQTHQNGHASAAPSAPAGKAGASGSVPGSRGVRREKMSPLRQRIASRLVEAQQTAAMLTTFNEVDMGAVMALRKQFKDDFEKKHGIGLGFMSFFVKAAAQALEKFPLINANIVAGEDGKPAVEHHDYKDIAIAVAGPKGLVVPVLRNCESMTFADVESGIKDFGTRAKAGTLELSEMTGGTFTITNGGVFGSLMSTPILNPPQSAILGMHGIKNRPVEYPEKSGQIALRPMMYLALSYDHRIVDGAEAVQFLVSIKNAIEDPTRLMLDL
jgi:2-oxoglutarate dehydrogenase E2 component (dihydrolipoamide succinyltransferase)